MPPLPDGAGARVAIIRGLPTSGKAFVAHALLEAGASMCRCVDVRRAQVAALVSPAFVKEPRELAKAC